MNETIMNAKSVFVVLRLAFAKRLDCGVFSAAILRSRAASQLSLKIGKEVLWRAAEYGMAMSGDVQKRRSTAAVQTLRAVRKYSYAQSTLVRVDECEIQILSWINSSGSLLSPQPQIQTTSELILKRSTQRKRHKPKPKS